VRHHLKPHDPNKLEGNGPLARFFRWFNDKFDRGQEKYERACAAPRAAGSARAWSIC
jgi:hypothetical protein